MLKSMQFLGASLTKSHWRDATKDIINTADDNINDRRERNKSLHFQPLIEKNLFRIQ